MLNHFYNHDCSNEPLLKRCSLACKNLKICILVSLYKQIICFGTDLVKYGTSLLLFLFKAYTFYMTFCEWCFYLVRFLISFSAHVLTIFLGLCLQQPCLKRNSPVTYLSRSLKTRIDVLYTCDICTKHQHCIPLNQCAKLF